MTEQLCLFCRNPMNEPIRFGTLLSPAIPPGLCQECKKKLAPIDRRQCCANCGRDLRLLDKAFIQDGTCSDCLRWKKSGRSSSFRKNRSLFTYNEQMKEIMTLFKFRGDAELAAAFKGSFRMMYREMIGRNLRGLWHRVITHQRVRGEKIILVPIPLSRERQQERGFNQALILAQLIGAPVTEVLIRRRSETKQSKKNRQQRLAPRENPFSLDPQYAAPLTGRRILLIDDIYTTGATLRLAADALDPVKPSVVDSLTLAHG